MPLETQDSPYRKQLNLIAEAFAQFYPNYFFCSDLYLSSKLSFELLSHVQFVFFNSSLSIHVMINVLKWEYLTIHSKKDQNTEGIFFLV